MPLCSPSRNPIDRSVAETITIIIVVYRISSKSDEIYRMSLGLWSSSVVLDNVMQFSPKMGMAEKQNFTCNKTKLLLLRLFFTATGRGTLCTLSLYCWWGGGPLRICCDTERVGDCRATTDHSLTAQIYYYIRSCRMCVSRREFCFTTKARRRRRQNPMQR